MAEAAEHADELTTARIPAKFHPSKKYTFPTFGSKGEKCSFRADWCEKYNWLHYNHVADAVFCHLCVTAERFLASTESDPAFTYHRRIYVLTGRMQPYKAFGTHLASRCHKDNK